MRRSKSLLTYDLVVGETRNRTKRVPKLTLKNNISRDLKYMKRNYYLLFIGLLLFSGCAQASTEVINTTLPTETNSPLPPSDTPEPVASPTPQIPTDTPEPTATATIAYSPTPDIPKESVEVTYEDRVIRGTMVGDGDLAVVLAPMFGQSRGSWAQFADHIASLGFTTLAFDFPGPFGTSSGEFKFDGVQFDAIAVINFLRERGYERIVCIGASIGATACFEAARIDTTLAGFAVISAPVEVTPEDATALLMPKLLVSSIDNEMDVEGPLRDAYQLLSNPKQYEHINQEAHGTELLNTGDELHKILVDFLENLR